MKNNLMKYKNYRAKVYYDCEDKIFVGEIIGIKDILAFHSENSKDLENQFHDCVDNYLDWCKEIGKAPDREYTGSFSVRVEPEEQRVASICAAAKDISLNQYFGEALSEHNKKLVEQLGIVL